MCSFVGSNTLQKLQKLQNRAYRAATNWCCCCDASSEPLIHKLGWLTIEQSGLISVSKIHPSLEYCSHVWGGDPKYSLHLLDKVQSKAIRLINNPNLTNSLQSLSHQRLVAGFPLSIDIFMEIALLKSRKLFLI